MIYSLCESRQLKSLSALVAESHPDSREKKEKKDQERLKHDTYKLF